MQFVCLQNVSSSRVLVAVQQQQQQWLLMKLADTHKFTERFLSVVVVVVVGGHGRSKSR